MIDSGPNARSIQINLNPFTLIGATTRSGLLTAPLLSRFAIKSRLEYYDAETLRKIILRSAEILNAPIKTDAAAEIAGRSRGTPRIANGLLRRVRDFAQVLNDGQIDIGRMPFSYSLSMGKRSAFAVFKLGLLIFSWFVKLQHYLKN